MPKIIILRGNSGSGKSTVAKALQQRLGRGTMLISQDYIRREMLWVRDTPANPAADVMTRLVEYGHANCEYIILEGILYSDYYAGLFTRISELFGGQIHAYYYDLPFEETLRRHSTKPNHGDFGETAMRGWWREKDLLPFICEQLVTKEMSLEETVEWICAAVAGSDRSIS